MSERARQARQGCVPDQSGNRETQFGPFVFESFPLALDQPLTLLSLHQPDFTSSYVLCRSPPAQLAFFQPEGEGTSSIWTSILQTAYPPPGSAKIESVGKQREDQLQAKRAKQLKKEEKMKRDEQRRQEREGEEMEQSGVEDENSVKD